MLLSAAYVLRSDRSYTEAMHPGDDLGLKCAECDAAFTACAFSVTHDTSAIPWALLCFCEALIAVLLTS